MLRLLPALLVLSAIASGCTATTPPSVDAPTAPAGTEAEVEGCDWFNLAEPGSWTPADPDLLGDWGVTGVDVEGGCQQVSPDVSQLGWYSSDEDVCTPVLAIVQPQLDEAGYTTVDQTPSDALTRTLLATSADGRDAIGIDCSVPGEGDDYQTAGSILLIAFHP